MEAEAGPLKFAYELEDGQPVSSCLHGGRSSEEAACCDTRSAGPSKRKPFHDVTAHFSEFYASAIAAATELKSPERPGSRFASPSGPRSAVKRLWNTELPPLPRPGTAKRVLAALESAGPASRPGQPASPYRTLVGHLKEGGSFSPTRRPHLASSLHGDSLPPLPKLPSVPFQSSLASNPAISGHHFSEQPGFGSLAYGQSAAAAPFTAALGSGAAGLFAGGALPFPLPTELGLSLPGSGAASGADAMEDDCDDRGVDFADTENVGTPDRGRRGGGVGCSIGGAVPPSPFPHLENQ